MYTLILAILTLSASELRNCHTNIIKVLIREFFARSICSLYRSWHIEYDCFCDTSC